MSRTVLFFRVLPLLTLVPLTGACDDPTEVEDHIEVEGFALVEAEVEIYRFMRDDGLPSTLELDEGSHQIEIRLLDAEGEPIPEAGHEEEDEHELRVTIGDNAVLVWLPEAHTDAQEFLEFEGQLNALQPGSTVMEVCVPHGDHCDFDADVPVTVVAATGA